MDNKKTTIKYLTWAINELMNNKETDCIKNSIWAIEELINHEKNKQFSDCMKLARALNDNDKISIRLYLDDINKSIKGGNNE